MKRIALFALLAVSLSACVTRPVADSQYVIIFESLSCAGECRLGDAQFFVDGLPNPVETQKRSQVFEISEEVVYPLNFGFRFNGPGVWWTVFLPSQQSELRRVLTVENEGDVTLNGPQRRSFVTSVRGRRGDATLSVTYFLYTADP